MLSKEDFVKYLNLAQYYSDISCKMYDNTNGGLDLWKCYSNDGDETVPECAIIELIYHCMDLEYDTLNYYCYECDFGRDKRMVAAQSKIDEKFDYIKSFEDLYDYIIEEEANS